jgi:hypothetical protein
MPSEFLALLATGLPRRRSASTVHLEDGTTLLREVFENPQSGSITARASLFSSPMVIKEAGGVSARR